MKSIMPGASGLGLASLALFAASLVHAQDVELLVRHSSMSTGADGVRRSTEFSERVTRTVDTVWVSRVLPADAHTDRSHAKDGDEHKHLNLGTATRWITRDSAGAVQMRLVPSNEKVLVTVTKPDYGNVGFDGSWAAAWSLIDPAALKRMKAGPASGDLTTYTLAEKDRSLKIVWNTRLQIPALVQSSDKNSQHDTVVEVVGKPATRPWNNTRGFVAKDYSDYLD
jgi:hypothetical protein